MKIKILLKRPTTAGSVTLTVPRLVTRTRPMRVLSFDCEARPLHWISGDYVSKEITAIAWAWCDNPDGVKCLVLGESSPQEMLLAFCEAYNAADLVTGHYIRGYDLPLVNGSLTEYQMPPLGDKLTQDTKIDLVRRQGLSGSQENLGTMLDLHHPKVKMDQAKWRAANRLTPEGVALTRQRCAGDVLQHIEMRQRLLDLGYLAPPKMWRGGAHDRVDPYTP